MKKIRFMLDGCDIAFVAEAPANMTVEQLVKQASRIQPNWCACGIRALQSDENRFNTEIVFDYDDVYTNPGTDVDCTISKEIE